MIVIDMTQEGIQASRAVKPSIEQHSNSAC